MKKLRNAVLKSGETKGQHTRKMVHQDNPIVWINAVEWDRNVNSQPFHFNVTDTHLYPNGSEKMRNQLAEQMLDEDTSPSPYQVFQHGGSGKPSACLHAG
jgi:hypothetical protein